MDPVDPRMMTRRVLLAIDNTYSALGRLFNSLAESLRRIAPYNVRGLGAAGG